MTLNDIRRAQILKVEDEDESCVLKVTARAEKDTLNYFYDVQNNKFIKKLTDVQENEDCKVFDEMEGNVSQKLERWVENLNKQLLSNTYHQNVLKVPIL